MATTAKYPGWRTMTAAQRKNAQYDRIWEAAKNEPTRFNASSRIGDPLYSCAKGHGKDVDGAGYCATCGSAMQRDSDAAQVYDAEAVRLASDTQPLFVPRSDTVTGETFNTSDNGPEVPAPPYDVVGGIMAWEGGDLDDEGTIELFQHLVDSGMAWSLQGCYGRTAQALIEEGYITAQARS